MVRLTDHPDMTIAVYHGHSELTSHAFSTFYASCTFFFFLVLKYLVNIPRPERTEKHCFSSNKTFLC